MRKIIYLLVAIGIILSSTACSNNQNNETTDRNSESETNLTTQETTELTTESTSEQTTEQPTETLPVDNGVIASHKDEYASDLYNVIVSLPEDMPESTLKQKNVDCDTLQWFNATYSMFTYDSGGNYHLVGGYSDESGYIDSYVTRGLEQSWGITDRASAIESIAWLAATGHTPDYVDTIQLMEDLGMLSYDEYGLRAYITEMSKTAEWTDEETVEIMDYYIAAKNIYDVCGENGIDAWDYCRIMQLCGSCYYAGYFTLEECLTIQLATAQVIQHEFDSWDAMNTSYLKGYAYWSYGTSAAISREWAYQQLTAEDDCPFKILDFNMILDKFW